MSMPWVRRSVGSQLMMMFIDEGRRGADVLRDCDTRSGMDGRDRMISTAVGGSGETGGVAENGVVSGSREGRVIAVVKRRNTPDGYRNQTET